MKHDRRVSCEHNLAYFGGDRLEEPHKPLYGEPSIYNRYGTANGLNSFKPWTKAYRVDRDRCKIKYYDGTTIDTFQSIAPPLANWGTVKGIYTNSYR